jgi:hypothetical protein
MPVSNPDHLPLLIHLTAALQPRRVLDVGVGMGSLGLLARQSLDICYGRIQPAAWETTIDGVEVFEGYRNTVWGYAYSQVHMGDVRTVLPALGRYDLVFCCDVLEHFEHAESRRLISALLAQCDVLIATTPNHHIPQDAWGGNEAERHLSVVTAGDFPDLALHERGAGTDLFVAAHNAVQRATIGRIAAVSPRTVPPRPPALWRRAGRKLRRLLR